MGHSCLHSAGNVFSFKFFLVCGKLTLDSDKVYFEQDGNSFFHMANIVIVKLVIHAYILLTGFSFQGFFKEWQTIVEFAHQSLRKCIFLPEMMGDHRVARRVLRTKEPWRQKALGRQVNPFNEELWVQHRCQVVFDGNMAKVINIYFIAVWQCAFQKLEQILHCRL